MAFLNLVAHRLEALFLPFLPLAHNDGAALKYTFGISMILARLSLLVRDLACFAPRKVVKVPEGVERQYKVPQWERDQVDCSYIQIVKWLVVVIETRIG